MNYNIQNWFGALAIIISFFSLIVAFYFNHKSNYAKRAYMVPARDPGKLHISYNGNKSNLEIRLTNAGINPARKIKAPIFFYNKGLKEIFNIHNLGANNPVPHNDDFIIKTSLNNADQLFEVGNIEYVKLYIKYYDPLLKKTFKDAFIWQSAKSEEHAVYQLLECDDDTYKEIKNL